MLCKRYKGFVALGLNEVLENKPYISMVWLGPEGVMGVYRKTYLWPNEHQKNDAEFAAYRTAMSAIVRGIDQSTRCWLPARARESCRSAICTIGCLICARRPSQSMGDL